LIFDTKKQHRLMAFGKVVLRITFASKRDEVTGGWRGLHSEEHKHNYSDPVKEGAMGKGCSISEEKRDACRILVGKPDGKRPLERPGRS
jgi:hypothetical protein